MHPEDVATELKGSNTEFTFFRSDSASRLDRFYINQVFFYVSNEVAFSDHMAVIMSYKVDTKCESKWSWLLEATLKSFERRWVSIKFDYEIRSLRNL